MPKNQRSRIIPRERHDVRFKNHRMGNCRCANWYVKWPSRGMNKTAMRRMIKRISTKPETYDESVYFIESPDRTPARAVASLEGQAVICSRPLSTLSKEQGAVFWALSMTSTELAERASDVLGFSRANYLKSVPDGSGWPAPYAQQFASAGGDKTKKAAVAVAYLKEALKRGTMIWEGEKVA